MGSENPGDGTGGDGSGDRSFDAKSTVLDSVIGFVRKLRANGVIVPADAAIVATRALTELDAADRESVRAALKATLVTRQRDIDRFEELFDAFWHDLRLDERDVPEVLEHLADAANPPEPAEADDGLPSRSRARDDSSGDETSEDATVEAQEDGFQRVTADAFGAGGEAGESIEIAQYSPTGARSRVERVPSRGDYGLDGSVVRMTTALSTMTGRRRTRTTNGRFVDGRRALRRSFGTGGVVASLPESEPEESVVRGTVLVDVSQSVLDTIERGFLLEWLRLLALHWRSLRVFFFDTDVREVTDAFDRRTVGSVSEALASAEAAWGGGTQIGSAFADVRRSYPGAVDRRTAVLVVSDGLERGELDALSESAARLSRRAALFLWLNPLATHPNYEPTARGMAAALPAVDGLFAFADADDVAEIARQLDRHDRRRLGYQFDPRRPTTSATGDAG
jgi:uncharacterized protein with von Willebrand factor type A (vWA) domain